MFATSRAEGFSTIASEDLNACITGSLWNSIQSRPENALHFHPAEETQESRTSPWGMAACAGAYQMSHFDNRLVGAAVASENGILPKRPFYTMEQGKMVLDPSAMEMNVPYCLDVFGAKIWAVKDSTDDVVFFELGE